MDQLEGLEPDPDDGDDADASDDVGTASGSDSTLPIAGPEPNPAEGNELDARDEFGAPSGSDATALGCDIHQRISNLTENYSEIEIWSDLNEDVSAALRGVGFHGGFDTGAELLKWYHDALEEAVREAINGDSGGVDSPELVDQVANDPAVKAAKKAYEDAFAKAYAEIRKRL